MRPWLPLLLGYVGQSEVCHEGEKLHMHLKLLFAAMPAALLVLGNAGANAQTINEAGALAA